MPSLSTQTPSSWFPARAGVPLAHQVFGTHEDLAVLLHGVGGGLAAWNDPDEGLAAALCGAGWRAAALDLPGYGASPPIAPPTPWTLAAMAEAVEAVVQALRPRRLVLIGHSMGGMLAQEIAARGRLVPDALVLAGTSPAFGRPEGEWQQAFLRERFAPLDGGLGMAALARSLVPGLLAPDASAEVIAAAQRLLGAVPESTYRAALSALVGFDRRADLPARTQPVLVLTGEHDRTASPEVAQRMAGKLPCAMLSVLPGAGHLANLETPAAFNKAVLTFLSLRDTLARSAGRSQSAGTTNPAIPGDPAGAPGPAPASACGPAPAGSPA